ncbi:MAG: hypothetical protein K8U57_23960 [Planctomycetes bacterium]|nr:hypothetical protein [Planctomycetota bacterium]
MNRCRYLLAAIIGMLVIGLCTAQADDVEVVKEKLFQAKKDYDKEIQKFRQSVEAWMDKREEVARAAGDKKTVDQVKNEREAFSRSGDLPSTAPAAIKQQTATARTTLDKAYSAAIKSYLLQKEDALAEAVVKEQQTFQAGTELAKGRSLQFSERGYVELQKTIGLLDINGSFTMEAWIRFDGKKNKMVTFMGDEAWPKMSPAIDVPHSVGWTFRLLPTKDGAKSIVDFNVAIPDTKWFGVRSSPVMVIDGEWHHLAVSKTPEVIRTFLGGKLVGEQDCKGIKFVPSVTEVYLGVRKNAYEDRRFEGQYRAFRISNTSRYAQAFEPPVAFAKDATTEILLDFSGNNASKLVDLSGKDHDGQLHGVKWADLPKQKK